MPSARSLFLERMSSLSRSLAIDAVTNRALSDLEHNNVARMLRNGLAVVGFAALEDFIKSRTSEVLEEIGRTGVSFGDLPERLRSATTVDAIHAFSYQLSIRPKTDRMTYVQEHSLRVASTATTAFELTPHAFGYDQANLQEETVKEILKSFKIDNPWGQMSQLASRLGLTALPLDETFKGAALRRHRAAHVAHADTPQTDLSQFVREAYAIAIGFDCLISKALSWLWVHDTKYLKGSAAPTSTSILIRTVKCESGRWKECVEGRKGAVKVERDIAVLLPLAKARTLSSKNALVQFGVDGGVVHWECH